MSELENFKMELNELRLTLIDFANFENHLNKIIANIAKVFRFGNDHS